MLLDRSILDKIKAVKESNIPDLAKALVFVPGVFIKKLDNTLRELFEIEEGEEIGPLFAVYADMDLLSLEELTLEADEFCLRIYPDGEFVMTAYMNDGTELGTDVIKDDCLEKLLLVESGVPE